MKSEKKQKEVCGKDCEVFSRIVGYFRPVQRWNPGKQEEFKDRVNFNEEKMDKTLKCKSMVIKNE